MPVNLLRRGAGISLLFLAALLPFEVTRPLLSVGPIGLTNVELVLLVTLALGLTGLWASGRLWPANVPRSWRWLWTALALGVLLAAWHAPVEPLNALKAALRTIEGLALATVVASLTTNRAWAWRVIAALLAGALVVTLLGLAEALAGAPLPFLGPLRQAPTAVGPFWRLSATFDHANQAAMYLEATLPLLLAATVTAWRRRPLWGVGLGIWLLAHAEAALLTYSRTTFATLIATGLATAVLVGWRRGGRGRARPWLALAGLLAALVVANAAANPVFRLRLTSEGDNEWYLVGYDVPAQLALQTGRSHNISLTLVNDGRLVWDHDGPLSVSVNARWEAIRSDTVYNIRYGLTRSVAPGERLVLTLPLEAPLVPGEYAIVWDLVQEDVVWFSQKNGLTPRTAVFVSGPVLSGGDEAGFLDASPARSEEGGVTTVAPPIPDRRTLWRVAWRQWQERPLLGIGLDNFRLTYGPYLGYTIWNNAIHTNNWYLETLVSLGLLGALPFFVWLASLVIIIVRRLRDAHVTSAEIAVGAGLMTFFIHGMLDYFMLFNPTALLFWLLTGLLLAPRHHTTEEGTVA